MTFLEGPKWLGCIYNNIVRVLPSQNFDFVSLKNQLGREQAQRHRFLAIFQNSPNGHMAGGGGGTLGLFLCADSIIPKK